MQRIERTTRLDIGLGLDQSDLRETEARLRRVTRRRAVPAYTVLDIAALRILERRVAVATRDRRIDVDIDFRDGLARLRAGLSRLQRDSGGSGGITFDDSGMSRYTKRILALSAAFTAATPAILGLAGALGQASGVLALLPALGLAGAAAVGVLALAFTGAKKNVELQKIKTELLSLKDAYRDLQQVVAGNLFEDLAKPIRALAKQYLPTLRKGLGGIATAMNGLTLGFIGFAASQRSLTDTGTGLRNTQSAITALTPGILAFAAAFRDVAVVGSTFLPELATGLSDVGGKFAAFIANARNTGELAEFFERSFAAVESLATSIGNLGDAFGGLIRANGDTAPFLANLEQATAAIANVINSVRGQAGFGALFDGISQGFAALFGNLGTFESLIGSIGPVLGEFFAQVGIVAGALLDSLAPALEALSPALVTLLSTLGGAFAGALLALSPAITSLATALGPVLTLLGDEFADVLETLAPVIATVAQALGGAFLTVVETLAPVLGDLLVALAPLAEALGVALADALETLAPHLETMARAFIDDIVPALLDLIPHLPALVDGFLGLVEALLPLIPALADLFVVAIELLPEVMRLLPALVTALEFTVGVITLVIGWIAALLRSYQDFVFGAKTLGWILGQAVLELRLIFVNLKIKVEEVMRAAAIAVALAVQGMRTALSNAILAFTLFVQTVRTKVGEAVETVRGLPGRIASALGNLGGILVRAGASLIEGLISGIQSRVGALLGTMANLAAKVAGFLPGSPVKTGPLTSWNNGGAGKALVGLLASGLEDTSRVDAAMRSLTSRIHTPNLDGTLGVSGGPGTGGGASLHIGTLYARDDEAAADVLARRFGDAAAIYGLVGA